MSDEHTPAAPQVQKKGALEVAIRTYVEEAGLANIAALADLAGLSTSAVYATFQPATTRAPKIQTLLALAQVMGKPLHELLYFVLPDAPGADVTWVPRSGE